MDRTLEHEDVVAGVAGREATVLFHVVDAANILYRVHLTTVHRKDVQVPVLADSADHKVRFVASSGDRGSD